MPLAPLADPWSKKVELKEDLEVLLLHIVISFRLFFSLGQLKIHGWEWNALRL